ncbi:MAG: sortase [Candidatus Margulisiibacteriota bacterium]
MSKILEKLRVLKFKDDIGKTLAVFIVAFLVLFFVFNFSAIISSVRYAFTGGDVDAENEMLTNMYREMYGYEARLKRGEISEEVPTIPVNNPANNSAVISNSTTRTAQVIAGNYIYIPKINVKAPIVIGNSTDQAQALKDLQKGVLLYPGSALPGQGGTTTIIGHSSSNWPTAKYGTIFSLLNKLNNGDTIQISFNGVNYAYQVNGKKTGSATELANASTGEDLILGTCWPIGTDKGRIIITASILR